LVFQKGKERTVFIKEIICINYLSLPGMGQMDQRTY